MRKSDNGNVKKCGTRAKSTLQSGTNSLQIHQVTNSLPCFLISGTRSWVFFCCKVWKLAVMENAKMFEAFCRKKLLFGRRETFDAVKLRASVCV